MEEKTFEEKYTEALETCSDDFFEAYGGDENLALSPNDFLNRWKQMGIEFPYDNMHDFLFFFQCVTALAWKKRNTAPNDTEGKEDDCE